MPPRPDTPPVGRISIVVCTYERPALLAALLGSVGRLADLGRHRIDVVVVDNSDTGSARAVVQAAAETAPLPIRYVEAHPPNISTARNAGVAATDAPVVAFLDDDQQLEPGWLAAVAAALAGSPQDVLFGPIAPRFEDEGAAGLEARALFTRSADLPAGADLLAIGRRASQPFPLSTANSIFRRATALPGPKPFDERFGQCGGEDFHLFCRLQRAGRRFGWVPGAAATDFVPRHRCDPAYLMRRHYAGGQAFAAALIRSSPSPRREDALVTLKALVQLALLPVAILRAALGSGLVGRGIAIRLAGTAGKLSWRRLYPLYRDEERRYASPAATRS